MKILNRHERMIAAPPERIAAIIEDFGLIWPAQIAPVPRRRGDRRYDTGLMLWEETERPGAVRAFIVLSPDEFQGSHWFELEPAKGGTLLRHTVEGTATGTYETIWSERIEPLHNRILEALLDNVQSAVSSAT